MTGDVETSTHETDTPQSDEALAPQIVALTDRREAIAMAREILRGPVSPELRVELNQVMRDLING